MVTRQRELPHFTEEEAEAPEGPGPFFELSQLDRWGQKPGLQLWVEDSLCCGLVLGLSHRKRMG